MAPEFGVGKPTIASEPASEKFQKVMAFPPLLMVGLYRPDSVHPHGVPILKYVHRIIIQLCYI
jgi:hypothetical protein